MAKRKGTPKKSTGRPCSVCSHKEMRQINNKIAEGISLRIISTQFPMSQASLTRHVQSCLKAEIAAMRNEQKIEQVFDFATELATLYRKATKMVTALEKWLVDPDNPDEYCIDPRDIEMTVLYADLNDRTRQGDPKQKKASLRSLLETIADSGEGIRPLSVTSAAVDNRKLYLDAFKTLNERFDQIARFNGFYQQDRKNLTEDQMAAKIVADLVAEGWTAPAARAMVFPKYGLSVEEIVH